jgi:hypothetical protein
VLAFLIACCSTTKFPPPTIPTHTQPRQACRNINYERLDAFLCTSCGFCSYAQFAWRFTAKTAAPGSLLTVGAAGDDRALEAQDRAEALKAYQRAAQGIRGEQAALRTSVIPLLARQQRAFVAAGVRDDDEGGVDEEEEGEESFAALMALSEAQESSGCLGAELSFSEVRLCIAFIASCLVLSRDKDRGRVGRGCIQN